jgi:gamma-glutamyltranspeptidase/glutathione hydrolase
LQEVLAPAIHLARTGIAINVKQAYLLDLLRPIMTLTDTGRALFAPEGRYLGEGDVFRNPQLAAFLATLPDEGEREFYEGELAQRITADMAEGGGLLTLADLAAYRVIERQPLVVDYRGYQMLTNPPPSLGGSLIARALQLLETHEVGKLGFRFASLVDAADRGDAGSGSLPRRGRSESSRLESVQFSRKSATNAHRIRRHHPRQRLRCRRQCRQHDDFQWRGIGLLRTGVGIMLNNMMGEDDLHPDGFHLSPPGLRVASMMAPSLLMSNNTTWMALGSGGSKRIRTALLQVISNAVDFAKTPRAAVEAPRLHWDGQWVQAEPGFSEAALAALAERWPVNRWPAPDVYFGGVHVAAV